VQGFTEALDWTVAAAKELVASAEDKLESKKKLVVAYEAKELQAGLNYQRQKSLFDSGAKPEKEVEKLKKEWDVAKSELDSIRQDVESLVNELAAKNSELEEKTRLAKTKIDLARAQRQDAVGSAATIRKEKGELEVKVSELGRLIVTAPCDGTIFRMPIYEQGQAVKEGEPIVTIVPDSSQNAVELWVPGNDMPLVQVGQEVRLQFEGWPAVQFAGWPSVAVGTFSGTVFNVDATDNGKGKFRILVIPNEKDKTKWPSDRYLRQGVRANGWVMLRRVSLGYEIWRQLNGFPVIISDEQPSKSESKPPKIPK
jgi:multidrug resistance efflux pump